MGGYPVMTKEYLFSRTRKTNDGCLEWIGASNRRGYGVTSLRRKFWQTHRLSWFFHHGDPGEMFVCHKCDNPACINIEHLFLGTPKDNIVDMIEKGRSYFGTKTHCRRGHSLEDALVAKSGPRRGRRNCRTCLSIGRKRRKRI